MESRKRRKRRRRRSRYRRIRLKKFNIFALIINIILLALVSIITFLILKYDILPFKYLMIYFVILVGLPLLILYFIFRRKTNIVVKVFLIILDILFIVALSFALFYVSETFQFLDEFANSANYITRNYMVLVPKNSEYNKIEDLEKQTIGYINLETANYKKAMGELNKKIIFTNKDYLDYTTLLEAFKVKEVGALLSTDSYYDSLCEEIENFETDYKIIYYFSIKEKVEDITKDVNVTKETFNIYITGMDTAGDISTISRSDVNIVVSVNPKTNQILMVNIPRDYYVIFHGQTNKDKLTHAGLYGTAMSIKTIEDILNIDINYYYKVNFNSVVNLVDTLGGVDVYSQYTFKTTGKGYYIRKGYNHVNGEQALAFSRTRKVLKDGDIDRGRNQEALIEAIIKKATTSSILTRYTSILESLKGTFLTNMSSDKITDVIKMQLDKMPKWNVTSMTLVGSGGNDYTSVFPDRKVYVMIPDENSIKASIQALEDVKKGKVLDSSYQENTGNVYDPFIPQPTPKPSTDKDEENKEDNTTSTKPTDDNNQNNTDINDSPSNNDEPDNNSSLFPQPNDDQNQDDNQSSDDTVTSPPDISQSTEPSDDNQTNENEEDSNDVTNIIPGLTD